VGIGRLPSRLPHMLKYPAHKWPMTAAKVNLSGILARPHKQAFRHVGQVLSGAITGRRSDMAIRN
jgi:hypothetical protein